MQRVFSTTDIHVVQERSVDIRRQTNKKEAKREESKTQIKGGDKLKKKEEIREGKRTCGEMGQARSSTSPQVILMGLDSAGKSTLLARLLTGQVMETSPTIGFNVGDLDLDKKTSLTVWDVGGQKSMRPNWRYYLEDCKALVFVVDSSDRARMPEARKALRKILVEEKLANVPLMVLANKKDLPNCMTIREISSELGLDNYNDRLWEIQACSGLKGLGLLQAFNSVNKLIKRS